MYADSARHAGHSVEDGPHHTRGNRDACLANTVTLLSKNGDEHIASISKFAPILLVVLQPSSQCPRGQVRDRLVAPSLQEA